MDTISEQKQCPFTGMEPNSKAVGDLIISATNVDPFPPKEARINRASARAEQCQGGTKSSKHDAVTRVSRMRDGLPQQQNYR